MMLRSRFFHQEAIDVLHYNKLEPHNVVLMLRGPLHLSDRHGVPWTFIARRQTRLYLMAKYEPMEQFKEVYSMGHTGEIASFYLEPYQKAGLVLPTSALAALSTPLPAASPLPLPAASPSLSYHDVESS